MMEARLHRRRMLGLAGGASLLGLSACATAPAPGAPVRFAARPGSSLAPLRATPDRLFDITVCIRPFRAAGPRLDAETIGDTLVVHNYGHGGSGWSLSWGSAALALEKAMANSPREIAVLGCGAIGLTTAVLAQRAGAKVTIYAKDLLPQTRSARATGSWTPDSRVALASVAGPAFADTWERMARTSWKLYRQFLGLPGAPVEFLDEYRVAGPGPSDIAAPGGVLPPKLDFGEYSDRIADLTPRGETLAPGATPFPGAVRRNTTLIYNVADYAHTLMTDFLLAGGRFVRREFHDPAELASLPEKVVINCPGYAARQLWKDESLVPIRGQIGWLIPQSEVRYGLTWGWVHMLSRRDGVVVQAYPGEMFGYGDDREVVDRAESERTVQALGELYRGFGVVPALA